MLSHSFKVRDFRDKGFFMIDDEYLNGYAKKLGTTTSMVYFALCRSADKDQVAFPSQEYIAEKIGLHPRTVRRHIKKLVDWNIVKAEKTRNHKGKFLHNTYYLLDKSEWKKPTGQESPMDNQRTPASGSTGHQRPHKETHNKETHNKKKREKKKQNPIKLTRGQVNSFLKAFPGLTTSELKEQVEECNAYMGMSSENINNPGLFFKKWLERYVNKYSSIDGIGDEEMQEIAELYKVPLSFVVSKYDDLVNYCESKGKTYENYLATLRDWVKKDAMKLREEAKSGKSRIRLINPQ